MSTIVQSKVAYVLVGWNNLSLLDEAFTSVVNQTYNKGAMYYVDNCSTDGSVDFVSKHYPETNIIQPGYNTGFAKGNNLAINEALKDPEVNFIALINTDARLDPNWSKSIIDFAGLKPKGAIYQGTTLDYYDHSIIDSTHIYISYNGQGTQGQWRHYYQGEIGPKKIFGANAAACMISRAFIENQPFKRELFDERMFMYLEDLDLSARATVLGWDNYLVPYARAYHMGSASSGKNPGYALYMTFRNNSAVLFKNLPLSMVVKMIPYIFRGDIDTIRVLWRLGRRDAAKKVIKGRIVGLLRLPLFIAKSYRLKRCIKTPKANIWRLMHQGY